MGPRKHRGIGSGSGGTIAAPQSPESGSGGAGRLRLPALAFGGPASELETVTSGRITLGMVAVSIIVLVGFYAWTHGAQGAA